jgi:hypothetical protein
MVRLEEGAGAVRTDYELFDYLDRWIAAQPEPPGLKEVLATKDVELMGAYILRAFRLAAAEAVAELDRARRARKAAVDAFGGDSEEAEKFLRSPHEQLGGLTPLAVSVASEAGLSDVMDLLQASG